MADIFVSYTSSDRDWAFWIGKELERLGHTPHLHEWEVPGGGDIEAWMEGRHDAADHILCVVSDAYLNAPHSSRERRSAQWAIDRPNFALPVFVEGCKARTLFANIKRCDLHGLSEENARARLESFLTPAAIPTGPVEFPGRTRAATDSTPPTAPNHAAFPGCAYALSNIPIAVPLHFLGRDDDLAAIGSALKNNHGRVAITALHGLRGVGKTTLAAAYAEWHRADYRVTWWIRAETESTMRADLSGLGVRLGWIAADAAEEAAVASALMQLRNEGNGILLVYDNAINAGEIRKYLPRGGAAQIIVTSNAPNWGSVAAPVEIEIWPKEVGADYLIARTGRHEEREAAMALSQALGGLPLAHEQAAAYCERIGVSFDGYKKRFEAAPVRFMDDRHDVSHEYHDGLTVTKTFALAIDEAAELHPAAEALIVHAALLAPEPIPLYLFSEAREQFGEPLASSLADGGLDEAIAGLRAFALVDRESIPDERDALVKTDCIRLHRLVREVAGARCTGNERQDVTRRLIDALAAVLPVGVYNDPRAWPRMRRLDSLALALVGDPHAGAAESTADVLNSLAAYHQVALAAYTSARPLFERALAIREKTLGPDDPVTALSLVNLGGILQQQGDLAAARPLFERALVIDEKFYGDDHPEVATDLNNLGALLHEQGDFAGALLLYERGLAIREKALGPDHSDTARSLNNLGALLQAQGDLAGARSLYERALVVREHALGPNHLQTANSLDNLSYLLQKQGELAEARPYAERALAIYENALGPDHPDTALSLDNLGGLLRAQGDLAGAKPYYERALDIFERSLGIAHLSTKTVADNTCSLLDELKMRKEVAALRKKFGLSK